MRNATRKEMMKMSYQKSMKPIIASLLIATMLIGVIGAVHLMKPVQAAPTPSDVLDRINRGLSYMDRMYTSVGGYYVVKEHPSIPIAIYNSANAKWFLAGAQDGNNDHSTITVLQAPTKYQIAFETGTDWDRNDVILEVTVSGYSDTQIKADVKMTGYSPDGGGTISVYVGGTLLGSGNWVGQTKTAISPPGAYGWPSFRYVHRHSTNLAQQLYANGKDLTKAKNLADFVNARGISTDVYDVMFWRSGMGPDGVNTGAEPFPDAYQYWDRTWWDTYIWMNGQWDVWWPRFLSSTGGYPYKSRILGAPGINSWQDTVFPNTVLYRLVRAMQIMAKGNYDKTQYDVNLVKSILDDTHWDGWGTQKNLYGWLSGYSYPGYPTYNTALFLAAASLFAWSSGDSTYRTYADQAAQRVVDACVTSRYIQTADYGQVDRPDSQNGFLTGYTSGSQPWKEIGTHGIMDYWWGLAEWLGWYTRMGPEVGIPVMVSMESTLLSVQALQIYYQQIQGQTAPYLFFKGFHEGNARGGSGYQIAQAFKGSADYRLYVKPNGGTPSAWSSTKAKNDFANIAATTWTVKYFIMGTIKAASGYTGSLKIQMKIWTSGGSLRWQSSEITVKSVTGGSGSYQEWVTTTFSPGITVNNGDIIEIMFLAYTAGPTSDIQGTAFDGVYITYPDTQRQDNIGFIHIGYMTASSYTWWGG